MSFSESSPTSCAAALTNCYLFHQVPLDPAASAGRVYLNPAITTRQTGLCTSSAAPAAGPNSRYWNILHAVLGCEAHASFHTKQRLHLPQAPQGVFLRKSLLERRSCSDCNCSNPSLGPISPILHQDKVGYNSFLSIRLCPVGGQCRAVLHQGFEMEWSYDSTSKCTSKPAKHKCTFDAGWKEAELPSQPGLTEKNKSSRRCCLKIYY